MADTASTGPASTGSASTGAGGAGAVRDGRVQAVREFNRVYTNLIGLLRGGYLDSPYSLTEARVLFELAQTGATGRGESEISALRRSVDIDAGYLSRILARFEADGLITRRRSDSRRPPPGHHADQRRASTPSAAWTSVPRSRSARCSTSSPRPSSSG